MTRHRLFCFMLLLATAGCIPTGGSYLRVEHPEATYMQEGCYGTSGPAHITFIPYHGAYLSLALYPYWQSATFGIHLPDGHTAQLLEKSIEVASQRTPLVPVRHGRRGSMPYAFKSSDPIGKEDYFGILTGKTEEVRFAIGSSKTAYKWYEFEAAIRRDTPESGSVILPPLRVDGADYPALTLQIQRSSYVELGPFNC